MELERLFAVLKKWWWFLALAVVIAGASSYFAISRQPPTFQARAVLMIGNAISNPNPTGNEISLPEQIASLYTPLANSQTVQDRTREALGIESLPSYAALPVPNTPFIEVVVTHSSPELATAVANELANQLISESPTAPKPEEQEQANFIQEQIAKYQADIEETEAEILEKEEMLREATSARDISNLERDIEGLRGKLRTLESTHARYVNSTGSGAVNSLSIFSEAEVPRRPIGPNMTMTVVTVSAIGFILAFSTAYLLEFLDDTIKKPDDLKWAVNQTILPGISKFETEGDDNSPLITLTDPRSPTAETYRALRTTIKAVVEDQLHGTLLITSSQPNEGKSVTSANLAIAMAQQGHNVLLIDGDLRRPTQHHLFNLKREPGLADLLHELNVNDHIKDLESLLKGVLQRTPERRLILLSCGSIRPAAFELLSSEIMSRILESLSQRFDFVIIDSPPVMAVSDAVALSTQVDYVVMVAEAGRIRRKDLKESETRLLEAHANIVGVALNRVKAQNNAFYSYYTEYYSKPVETLEDADHGRKKAAVPPNQPAAENSEWHGEPITQAQTE